eukprot:544529_1
MHHKTKQERLLAKEKKRIEKRTKQALQQLQLNHKKDEIPITNPSESTTFKNNTHNRKKQKIQLLNAQLSLLNKINHIQSYINNKHKSYLNTTLINILDENLLNSLPVLNRLKPSKLYTYKQSEYLISGYIRHHNITFESFIIYLLLEFHGYTHTKNGICSKTVIKRQRTRLIQKLMHQTNTYFKQYIVNLITSTYPTNKKMHRDLKKVLKQYQKSTKTFAVFEHYKLLQLNDTQICYEQTDFPFGFPIFFICDVSNSSTARLSIVGSLFNGMNNDFTPQIFGLYLDKFPIGSNNMIQFYEKPCGSPVIENDKSLIVYYKGVNIVNNGCEMNDMRINSLIDYKINSCFLENKFILIDKIHKNVIWSYIFTIKQYFEWYDCEIFNKYFPIEFLDFEIIYIIKSYCWQNISFLFKNYNDKCLILWFLCFVYLNNEWMEWIIKKK